MTELFWWLSLLGGGSLGLFLLGRRCHVRAGEGPVVVRGRRLRRRRPARLRLVRPGQPRKSFRLPLLEVAHRLDLPLRLRTLVPYAYCRGGTPISFELRARLALSDDPRAQREGLPRLLAARRPYLRALLESELDRAARKAVADLSPRRASLRRGLVAGRVSELLRAELSRWALVVAELEASAPTRRPLTAAATSTVEGEAPRWRASARTARREHTPGISREDVEHVNTTRERREVHG